MTAHIKDLNDVATTFPELFATAISLLDAVQTEITSLNGVEDWEEIQTQLGFVVRNIEIIREEDFERLLSQLESADESLNAMGTGIADGDLLLSEALRVYETATATKVDFLSGEISSIPAKVAAAESSARTTSDTLIQTRTLMNERSRNLKLFQDKRTELNESTRLYYSKSGGARLNPIYTALIGELMKRASTKKPVFRQKEGLEKQLQQPLSSFNGTLIVPESSENCRRGQAKCAKKPKVKMKNSAAKALQKTQSSMRPEIPNLITSLSRGLAGISLSDLVAKIEGAHRGIMNIK